MSGFPDRRRAIGVALALTLLLATPRAEQLEEPVPAPVSLEVVVNRMNRAESAVVARMRGFHPLVEVYIQNLDADDRLGSIPIKDEYFLGRLVSTDERGPRLQPLTQEKGSLRQRGGALRHPFSVQYLPDGFAAMAAPDWRLLDPEHYEFRFVKREFLGEARCFVVDVRPRGNGRDGFMGRIWIEDRTYNIVRFNGVNQAADTRLSSFFRSKISFHVDSWRINTSPGVW